MKKKDLSWEKAIKDLDLKVEYNFSLTLNSGEKVDVELLLKNFGGTNGMLIVCRMDKQMFKLGKELLKKGYGYSVAYNPDSNSYNREGFVGMLSDWGWSGPKEEEPDWILPVDDEGNVIDN